MKVVYVKQLAEGASLWTLAGVSAWASQVAPIVAILAGAAAFAWSVIQIYDWAKARRSKKE